MSYVYLFLFQHKKLLLAVLQFTALLIEHSFSRHFYNSMEVSYLHEFFVKELKTLLLPLNKCTALVKIIRDPIMHVF